MQTLRLSEWLSALTWSDIPEEVRAIAKIHLADSVGVGIAASAHESGRTLVSSMSADSPSNGSTILSAGAPGCSAPYAAWVNGTLSHLLDFDDTGFSHPTSCIAPAAISFAEKLHASGADVLRALVVGYEVFERIARCGRTQEPEIRRRGFHPTSLWGPPAAAAACGVLAGLEPNQMARAISIAASSSGGLNQHIGTPTKGLHAGNSARAGMEAVQLVQAGFGGNMDAIDGPFGLLNAILGNADQAADSFSAERGTRWAIVDPGLRIKLFPVCGYGLSAIEATLAICTQHGLSAEEVATIEVHVHPAILNTLRFDWPADGFEARFSLRFFVAAAVVDQVVTLETFEGDLLQREAVNEIGNNTSIVTREWGLERIDDAHIVITTMDGTVFEASSFASRGGRDSTVTHAQLKDKFKKCVQRVVDDTDAERLYDDWSNVEQHGDIRSAFAGLKSSRGASN